eukprot:Phypoly_transcript_05460.p1 GENE.Phypoly_transcript_05460~~Phypoly_transcript_05460.p1  ORF type:complete len:448 (+),score=81.90 Phypoly_transcript_05460:145-1488(+)
MCIFILEIYSQRNINIIYLQIYFVMYFFRIKMSAPNSPDSFIFSSEEEREELKQQIKEEKETASDKNSDIYSGEERKEEAKQKIKKEKNKRIIYDSTNSETDLYEKMDEDDRKQIWRNERDGRKQKKKTENEGKRNDTKEGKKHSAKEKRRKSKKNGNELKESRLMFETTDGDTYTNEKIDKKEKKDKGKEGSAFERDKKRDHDIAKIIKREEGDDSERESKNKRMKTPVEQITEEVSANSLLQQTQKNDESKQSTLHHTFKVDCTKCKVEVSTKDLGDTAISPTCVSWAVECSSCTGSKANVTRYGQYTFKMTVLRALFLLHVKNPQREYWQISEVANIMRGSSAEDFKRATENSEKLKNGFSASIGNVLARFSFAGTLKHHDKGLYMYIYPLVNSDENSARPSITSAKPGQSTDTQKKPPISRESSHNLYRSSHSKRHSNLPQRI